MNSELSKEIKNNLVDFQKILCYHPQQSSDDESDDYHHHYNNDNDGGSAAVASVWLGSFYIIVYQARSQRLRVFDSGNLGS